MEATHKIVGATVPAPAGAGWEVVSTSDSLLVFERVGEDEATSMRAATLSMPRRLENDDALRALEDGRKRQIDTTRFDILTIHFNRIRDRGVPCVQYDFILKDRSAATSGPLPLDHTAFYGHACYASPEGGRGIEMEASYRSRSRDTPEHVMTAGEHFIGAVVLEDANE